MVPGGLMRGLTELEWRLQLNRNRLLPHLFHVEEILDSQDSDLTFELAPVLLELSGRCLYHSILGYKATEQYPAYNRCLVAASLSSQGFLSTLLSAEAKNPKLFLSAEYKRLATSLRGVLSTKPCQILVLDKESISNVLGPNAQHPVRLPLEILHSILNAVDSPAMMAAEMEEVCVDLALSSKEIWFRQASMSGLAQACDVLFALGRFDEESTDIYPSMIKFLQDTSMRCQLSVDYPYLFMSS